MIVGTPKAKEAAPIVALACCATVAKSTVDEVAEPVADSGEARSRQPGDGVHVHRGAQPRDRVEIADHSRQGRGDRVRCQSGGVVAVLDRQVIADRPLHSDRVAVHWAVAGDVGRISVHPDDLERAMNALR
jgi:hypothetical protein